MAVRFADRMERVRPSAIRELLRHGDDPGITSFGGGYPDPSLFPVADLRRVYAEVLAEQGRSALQYAASVGLPALRAHIAARMTDDGMPCEADDILVLQGAQQGLDLVAKMLIDPGDVIVTEDPTFLGALIAFHPYQPRYVAVPTDDRGMDVDALARALAANPSARFVYLVPDHQNPTGVTTSLERRVRLLELAEEFDVLVLEDTPYRELCYEGGKQPTLRSLDTGNRVIHLGSFSKTMAPGMRLGWASASRDLLERLGLLKLAADTQSSTLNMTAAARFLAEFDLDAHIRRARDVYRRKRDLMLDTMTVVFPASVRHTRPRGGLFTWVTFPEGFDSAVFMAERALPLARVAYVPGATFFPAADRPNHARFSFSGVADEQLVDGLGRLGDLLTHELG